MLNEYVAWGLGFVPYLLFLILGIAYSVLHLSSRPHACRWTVVGLAAAILALISRPWLTGWPYLLSEPFPRNLAYHSFMSALLDVIPLCLLLTAIVPGLRQDDAAREGDADSLEPGIPVEDRAGEPTASGPRWKLPRWAWLAVIGTTLLIAAQLAFVAFLSGRVRDVFLALLGAAPVLSFLAWARFRWLPTHSSSSAKTWASRALEAALLIWFAVPTIFLASHSFVEDHPLHPLGVFLISLASAVPVGLLFCAVLRVTTTSPERQAEDREEAVLTSHERKFVEILWLILWGIGFGVVAVVSYPFAVFGFEAVVQPDWYDGSGAGRGGGVGTATWVAVLGSPVVFLIGFWAGAVTAARRERRKRDQPPEPRYTVR